MEKPALPTALHCCGARGCAEQWQGCQLLLQPSAHILSICDSMAKHTRAVEVDAGTHKLVWINSTPITWLIFDPLHLQSRHYLPPLPLLSWFFFKFALILHTILVAMQGLQAQLPVTTPLHGCVQLGCSEDILLINLLFFCIVILDAWK